MGRPPSPPLRSRLGTVVRWLTRRRTTARRSPGASRRTASHAGRPCWPSWSPARSRSYSPDAHTGAREPGPDSRPRGGADSFSSSSIRVRSPRKSPPPPRRGDPDRAHHRRQHGVALRAHPRAPLRLQGRRATAGVSVGADMAHERHRVRALVLGARPRRTGLPPARPAPSTRLPLSSDVDAGSAPVGPQLLGLPLHLIHERNAFSPTDTMPLTAWAKILFMAGVAGLADDDASWSCPGGEHPELTRAVGATLHSSRNEVPPWTKVARSPTRPWRSVPRS